VSVDVAGGASDLHENIVRFLSRYYREEIGELAQRYPREQSSLTVRYTDLYAYDIDIAEDIRTSPDQMRPHFETALADVDLPADVSLDGARVRFGGVDTDALAYDVGEYSRHEVGTLIGIRGQVNKATQKRMRLIEAAFECQRCGTVAHVPQDSGKQEPHECQGCERQGPFRLVPDQSEFVDDQLIRLQLPPEKSEGRTDANIDIVLDGDLVKSVSPGDRVQVDAQLGIEQKHDDKPIYEFVGEAEHIGIQETDFEDIEIDDEDIEAIRAVAEDDPYEAIVGSIAPSLKGLDDEKLAIGLQLFGGTRKEYPDGSIERGDSHILFVGDPGVGKSALLSYAHQMAPRSVFTDGKGSTAAGLTASAVRDDFGEGGQWTIEGGSIVKAHKGVACIDELDDMDEEDRSSLHTALEKQAVPVSKAGITTELPARTKLLAAANPIHGRFDRYEPVNQQIGIRPALLSRFDLIFTLEDTVDRERDREIIKHKSDVAEVGQRIAAGEDVDEELMGDVKPEVPPELFRKYVAYATQEITPVSTEAAKSLLNEKFEELRHLNAKQDEDPEENPVPVTLRKQEAILRLAEASARARLSNRVSTGDVERALELVERSMQDVGLDPETGEYDTDIVETGSSKSQDQRKRLVLSMVDELEDESENGASVSAVLEACVSDDYSEDMILREINNLAKSGDLYETQAGYYRTT